MLNVMDNLHIYTYGLHSMVFTQFNLIYQAKIRYLRPNEIRILLVLMTLGCDSFLKIYDLVGLCIWLKIINGKKDSNGFLSSFCL